MVDAGERPLPGRWVPYVLAACTAVSILSTDLIAPSIPDLPEAFDTSIMAAQLTVSVNLAAYALAQLVHGPVSDAIGRRRLLIWAFLAFAGFSVFCALATSIDWLLSGRFLQGLVSSVPSVVIVLMIRELYGPDRALSVMALYGAALGLAPALGPLIGGYLHVWFGWQAGFWFVAVLALIVAALVRSQVPESLRQRERISLSGALTAYAQLVALSSFFWPAVGVSLMFGALYAYISTAPVVFIDIIGLPTERYGLTNVVIVAAFVLGNVVASRLSSRAAPAVLLRWSAVLMVGAMLGLLAATAPTMPGIVPILGCMVVYAACLAIVLAAGPLVVLAAAEGRAAAGPAAALLGSMQLAASALAGYCSAVLFNGTALPMAVVMFGFVAVGAAMLLVPRVSPSAQESSPGG